MRLFIALDAEQLRPFFEGQQKRIGSDYAAINFTDSYHLTLKFLGDVMPQYADKLKELLSSVTIDPFTITFSKTGFFTPKKVRVIWAGLEDNRKVMKLQASIDNALRDYYPKEERFHPHVTLGRVKQVYNHEALKKHLQEIPTDQTALDVNTFKLILSTLTSLGPIYEDLAVFGRDQNSKGVPTSKSHNAQ